MTESEAIPLKLVCPECGFTGKVMDMRSHKGMYIRRRRECENGHRWTTYEFNAIDMRKSNAREKSVLLRQDS